MHNAYAQAQRQLEAGRAEERTPERIVAAQLELEAIRAVIQEMPLNWRVALALQRFRNMSYEKIALHMGVTVRQVERYLYRAAQRLHKARRKIEAAGEQSVLKNLQEIISGEVGHALVRLWSDELSEAEAAAIHNRAQGNPNYRADLDGLLGVFASMEGLAGDGAMQELAREPRLLLRKRSRKQRFALGMAAGMLVAVWAVLTVYSPWRGPDDSHLEKYFTRIGQQQTIELADGSLVTLNTGSQLVVDYSGQVRRILLGRGEAYFEVAEDRARPFTVILGTHAVTALGTTFNVRKDPERYQVAVIEGAVALHEAVEDVSAVPTPVSVHGPGPRRVEAGWVAEFDVSRNQLTAFQPESMDSFQDWRSGLLRFYFEPLSQVVHELNRYSHKKILIEDASVMELRVVTAIRVTHINAALHGLEQALPIEVTRHYDRIVITGSAGNGN